jgi:phosphoglycolate phosphatase
MIHTVFLDLDGTLTDAGPGIIASVIHALDALGIAAPAPESLGWVIGPPLIDTFSRLGTPNPSEALRHYRARYTDVGLFENSVYPGIPASPPPSPMPTPHGSQRISGSRPISPASLAPS